MAQPFSRFRLAPETHPAPGLPLKEPRELAGALLLQGAFLGGPNLNRIRGSSFFSAMFSVFRGTDLGLVDPSCPFSQFNQPKKGCPFSHVYRASEKIHLRLKNCRIWLATSRHSARRAREPLAFAASKRCLRPPGTRPRRVSATDSGLASGSLPISGGGCLFVCFRSVEIPNVGPCLLYCPPPPPKKKETVKAVLGGPE